MRFVTLLILGMSLAACANEPTLPAPDAPTAEIQASAPAPNVIVILTDDLGYMDVGFNGGTDIPTPNIDRIASEGVRFTRGYVSHPVCGPSRAGLLTGRYQGRFGFYQNPNNDPRDPRAGIPLSQRLIPDLIAPAGYKSAAIGKWHMGAHTSLRPLERGFDEFFGFLSGSHHYFADEFVAMPVEQAIKPRELHRTQLRRGDTQVETSGYITDLFSEDTVRFIGENSDRPFFVYLAYNAPHVPLEATEKYLARFSHIENEKRRTYAAMVSAVDDGVGLILDKLDAEGLSENTIVFFLSDNGGIVVDEKTHPDYHGAKKGSSWNGSDNGVLRAGKGTLFEGGTRVPFAMRWPAEVPAGLVYDHPVISLDILGTVMGVNYLASPNEQPLDGVNLLPYLTAEVTTPPHEALFWRQNPVIGRRRFSVVTGEEKYFADERSDLINVYNLTDDVSETTDLSEGSGDYVTASQARIEDWIKDMPADHEITTSSIPWPR